VNEIRDANSTLSGWELYRQAMRVGRDHMALVDTLVLACAGASLPLLVVLGSQSERTATLISREFLAVEVVRTLLGSIGLVAAVSLTTLFAALMGLRQASPESMPEP
jgi:uncharacterized membrane protein